MKTTRDNKWVAIPGSRIQIIKWFDEKLPVGTKGTVVGTGKRPNGVNYYDVKWDNGKVDYIYDSLLYGYCEKLS